MYNIREDECVIDREELARMRAELNKPSLKIGEWAKGLPTEAGIYLFYGWVYDFDRKNRDPSFTFVEVRIIGESTRPSVTYIVNGALLWTKEIGPGVFARIEYPEPPKFDT